MAIGKMQLAAIGAAAILVVAGLAILLTSSSDDSSKTDLVFASGNKDCYEPTWLAKELGYYTEFGVNVEMLTVSGGGKALEALLSGQADIAGFGSTPLVNLLNVNVSDQYVVLARWMGGESYAEMASNVKSRPGPNMGTEYYAYSLQYPQGSVGTVPTLMSDGTTKQVKMDPIAGSHMVMGMDTTTGYYASLVSYCNAVGLTCKKEGDTGAESADILIKHREFSVQVASLVEGNDIDGLMGGSYGLAARAVSNNVILSKPDLDMYPSLESEATCVLAASADAYANKYDKIVGVLKAIQKASCYIYGIEYTTDILTPDVVAAKQAALSPTEKTALFGSSSPSEGRGLYYRTDACKRIADFFGYPFTTEVQRLSYDKYVWGLNFELVDMKLIKISYDNVKASQNKRDLTGLDYMNYFDGRALYDALKGSNGSSSWNADRWFVDASTYFCTEYTITLGTHTSDITKIYVNVVNGLWNITFLDQYGKSVDVSIHTVTVTMGGVTIPDTAGWSYDASLTLTFERILTGNVIITVA